MSAQKRDYLLIDIKFPLAPPWVIKIPTGPPWGKIIPLGPLWKKGGLGERSTPQQGIRYKAKAPTTPHAPMGPQGKNFAEIQVLTKSPKGQV